MKNRFVNFLKNQLIADVFEKRFAGGICDLRGYPACFVGHPILRGRLFTVLVVSDQMRPSALREISLQKF